MARTPPPPATKQHTFGTGIVITYRPISSWQRIQLAQRATRSLRHAQPQPPTFQDDFGGPPTPNPSDPAYLAALADHQARIAIRTFQWAAQLALVVDAETMAAGLAAHQAEADALAAFLAELPPEDATPEPTELDRFLEGAGDPVRWLLLIAAGGDTMALTEWMFALYGGGGMNAEAVASATEMFSSDLPRHEHLDAAPAAVGAADRDAGADLDAGGRLGERDADDVSRAAG